jgi:Na+/H+-dicarboxylate symporter
MTFPRRILVGLFLGEFVAPLRHRADGFAKLLQMTALPYVTVSIIVGLGSLYLATAKQLGFRAGAIRSSFDIGQDRWPMGATR